MTVTLHLGDCLDVMRSMPDACVDAVVTDPPYGLAFMGKQWDHGVPGVEFWAEALRVAKPGAHILAFGGTRTFHRLACAIEDAGWQIRDCLSWLYGSGFPKHKTLLKPAWEPVVMAEKAGRRVVNIEECRIGTSKRVPSSNSTAPAILYGAASVRREDRSGLDANLGRWPANVCLDEEAAALLDQQSGFSKSCGKPRNNAARPIQVAKGAELARIGVSVHSDFGGASRFFFVSRSDECERASTVELSSNPPNERAASARSDAATPGSRADQRPSRSRVGLPSTESSEPSTPNRSHASTVERPGDIDTIPTTATFCESCGCALPAIGVSTNRGDAEVAAVASAPASATRFLYTPKASRSEREAGLREAGHTSDGYGTIQGAFSPSAIRNHHPTVKPVALMLWLVRLVTPPGGVVLDPFMGSGTTGIAAVQEGRAFVGVEREPEYHSIAEARIAHARGETPANAEQPALDFGASA